VLEQSDEVEDLPVAPYGVPQGERSDCRREVSKASSEPRHEPRDVQIFYLEFLDVGQHGKLK